ncbi:MAG: glycogen synthase GlgA [Xanthomonadales bacterium]|nr:glycogen synthase GlgA [Xanthomonadales bacterium]
MKICLASSEFAPFAKTGGLADVSAALSHFLHREGHEVVALLPRYGRLDDAGLDIQPVKGLQNLSLRFGYVEQDYAIDRVTLEESGLGLYLLRCPELYNRGSIYTQDEDEYLRFVMLSRAALELCQRLGFAPDIVHCHDWQTALMPLYLRSTYAWDRLFANTHSVLTIHNIGYQGMFPAWVLPMLELHGAEHHLHQDDLKDGVINFLKTGVLYAHVITTVSPTYAREILGEDFGMGLNGLLRERLDTVIGILNGVDYDTWDPAVDRLIPANYSIDDLEGKATCKTALQRETGLEVKPDRPLFGIVSRLVGQKGFELAEAVLPGLLEQRDCAVAVLGSGEKRYEDFFHWLQQRFPGRASFYRGYSEQLAHWIEAGADLFLMPSRYEPSGLNQMYSLRYGTVPVVRETGGLADSVRQIDAAEGTGDGILFRDFNPEGFAWACHRGLDLYADRDLWRKIMRNGMRQDFSWERQGAYYVDLYRRLANRPASRE